MGLAAVHSSLPNFLIVGAPRCGTTALYHYLNQHHEVFMSPVKEPCFFSASFMKFPHNGKGDNVWEQTLITKLSDYQALFSGAKFALRRGEASSDYLFRHEQVIPLIKKRLGDIPIIIILRNPVERAFSAYCLLRQLGRENLEFEKALQEEPRRIAENYSLIWHYQRLSYYSSSVKAYLCAFSHVGIFFFEDFKRDYEAQLHRVYNFLGVDADLKLKIKTVYNASGEPRNHAAFRFLTQSNPIKRTFKPIVDSVYPETKRMHLVEKWKSWLVTKPTLKTETRRRLSELYRRDIVQLQDILEHDMTGWLT